MVSDNEGDWEVLCLYVSVGDVLGDANLTAMGLISFFSFV